MVKQIALKGDARIAWVQLRGRAAAAVRRAVLAGELPNLKSTLIKCVDCKARAEVYDHRDYTKPLQVEPVCKSCNTSRGTNAPQLSDDKIRCPNCNYASILYRTKKQEYWCRRCGHEWKKTKEKK